MTAIVTDADNVAPRFNDTFLEYAQSRGFVIDAARVGKPRDKACVSHCTSWVGSDDDYFARFFVPGGRPMALRGMTAGIS